MVEPTKRSRLTALKEFSDKVVDGSRESHSKQPADGGKITINSFYGLKYSSSNVLKTPKLRQQPKSAPNITPVSRPRSKTCPRAAKQRTKVVPRMSRTVESTKSHTTGKTQTTLTPPASNEPDQTPKRFFTSRSRSDTITTTLFSKRRLSLADIKNPKNISKRATDDSKSSNLINCRPETITRSPLKTIPVHENVNNAKDGGSDISQENILSKISTPEPQKAVTPTSNSENADEDVLLEKSDIVKSRFKDVKRHENDGMSQMMIDVGQKNVASVICGKCGMLYLPNSVEDYTLHYKFHNERLDTVPFNGWKVERVVKEYCDGRVILVFPSDPKYATKKVEEVRWMMDYSLGVVDKPRDSHSMQTYLFVADKKVVGCVIGETITKAYRVLERTNLSEPLCCSADSQRAVCGISRMWTATAYRRKKIATRLLDCVRETFYYGCAISTDEIAFTAPTPSGQKFAANYVKNEAYLFYERS